MSCEDCATTHRCQGAWHGYTADCFGCVTRGIARSDAAWWAMSKDAPVNDPTKLREMLQRLFPDPDRFKEARQAVWDWWQLDHTPGVPA